jgi:hypothetical protein
MRKSRKSHKVRFDTVIQPNGALAAAWGFRSQGDAIVKEYLAVVYRIPEGGQRDRAGVSHEFSLFMLAPEVSINYKKSIFEQPTLRPLVPAAARIQLRAADDADAVERALGIVEALRAFEGQFVILPRLYEGFLDRLLNMLSAPPPQDDKKCFV